MKGNHSIILRSVLAAAFLLVFAGCIQPAKYTGGGSLDSVVCGEKAHFGFVFNGCVDAICDATGEFNYHDKAAGVKMKGELYDAIKSNAAWVSYRSTNPQNRGEGLAKVTFTDLGEGNGFHGYLTIRVMNGPFEGYCNQGLVQGNIQYHDCYDDEYDGY